MSESTDFFFRLETGDRLLPLSADVEESPFLTLQEVEAISKQKLVSAHGGREVPEVNNPTWKTENNENAPDASPQQNEMSPSDVSEAVVAVELPEPIAPYIGHQIPEDFLKKAGLLHEDGERESELRPIYKLNADGSLPGEQSRHRHMHLLNSTDSKFVNFMQKHQTKCLTLCACSATRSSAVDRRRL